MMIFVTIWGMRDGCLMQEALGRKILSTANPQHCCTPAQGCGGKHYTPHNPINQEFVTA
jgi:hypothetical protein